MHPLVLAQWSGATGVGQAFLGKHSGMGREGITSAESQKDLGLHRKAML